MVVATCQWQIHVRLPPNENVTNLITPRTLLLYSKLLSISWKWIGWSIEEISPFKIFQMRGWHLITWLHRQLSPIRDAGRLLVRDEISLPEVEHPKFEGQLTVAEWYGAGPAIARSRVRIPPTAAVYQRQLSVPSLRGRLMSTSESWG